MQPGISEVERSMLAGMKRVCTKFTLECQFVYFWTCVDSCTATQNDTAEEDLAGALQDSHRSAQV